MERSVDAEKARQELHASTIEGRKIEVSKKRRIGCCCRCALSLDSIIYLHAHMTEHLIGHHPHDQSNDVIYANVSKRVLCLYICIWMMMMIGCLRTRQSRMRV